MVDYGYSCKQWLLLGMIGAASVAGIIALLFVIWLNGGLNYTVAIASAPAVCPRKFEASTIIIEQSRQTVVCVYDDEVLVDEQIHERKR